MSSKKEKEYVVITGCNKGIGKETMNVFSEAGYNIFACVRNSDKAFQRDISNLKNGIYLIKINNSEYKFIKL